MRHFAGFGDISVTDRVRTSPSSSWCRNSNKLPGQPVVTTHTTHKSVKTKREPLHTFYLTLLYDFLDPSGSIFNTFRRFSFSRHFFHAVIPSFCLPIVSVWGFKEFYFGKNILSEKLKKNTIFLIKTFFEFGNIYHKINIM